MKAVVAERGQVTIPKALRQKLGIRKGTVLDFEVKDSKLMAVKTQQMSNIEQVYGCLGELKTDQIMQQLRGKHDYGN